MITGTRDRFKEAPWYDPEQTVTVGGLGSIGSWLTFMLGRLVNKIYVYDFDVIEAHNLSGQLYGESHVGDSKSASIISISSDFNPNTVIAERGEFTKDSGVTPISFSCFDNMEARRYMFENWKDLDNPELFVDGRLTAEQLWVYAVTPDKIDDFEEYMFTDDEMEDLPCSFKSTTHISSMIASYMTVMFTNYLHNKQIEDIRELPLETTFTAPMTMQETT